jgi:hypothetical protein
MNLIVLSTPACTRVHTYTLIAHVHTHVRSHVQARKMFPSGVMDKQVLRSSKVPMRTHYVIGVYRENGYVAAFPPPFANGQS